MAHPLHSIRDMGVSHLAGRLGISVIVVVLSAAPMAAVTPDELVALSKEGLGDEVLIALIDASGLSAVIDATRAIQLKRQGVSDRVIAAAVRASAPSASPVVEPAADPCWECGSSAPVYQPPEPPVIVERDVVHREVYYVPWVVAPSRHGHGRKPQPYLAGNPRLRQFINDGLSLPRDTKAGPHR